MTHCAYCLHFFIVFHFLYCSLLSLSQERVIEQLKEKREKEEWEKHGEMEVCYKENKELKDKIASLQTQLLEKEVSVHMLKRSGQ